MAAAIKANSVDPVPTGKLLERWGLSYLAQAERVAKEKVDREISRYKQQRSSLLSKTEFMATELENTIKKLSWKIVGYQLLATTPVIQAKVYALYTERDALKLKLEITQQEIINLRKSLETFNTTDIPEIVNSLEYKELATLNKMKKS